MRTPMREVRGLGSAGTGTSIFVRQRLTAVAQVVLVPAFVAILIALAGRSHLDVVAALSSPLVAILMAAAIISVCIHMRIGMQVIIEDYVHLELAKLAALIANALYCAGIALVCLFAILKISFGV
jgi:succinate dehydrogenase / fumarate reductase membrane anchor subunit